MAKPLLLFAVLLLGLISFTLAAPISLPGTGYDNTANATIPNFGYFGYNSDNSIIGNLIQPTLDLYLCAVTYYLDFTQGSGTTIIAPFLTKCNGTLCNDTGAEIARGPHVLIPTGIPAPLRVQKNASDTSLQTVRATFPGCVLLTGGDIYWLAIDAANSTSVKTVVAEVAVNGASGAFGAVKYQGPSQEYDFYYAGSLTTEDFITIIEVDATVSPSVTLSSSIANSATITLSGATSGLASNSNLTIHSSVSAVSSTSEGRQYCIRCSHRGKCGRSTSIKNSCEHKLKGVFSTQLSSNEECCTIPTTVNLSGREFSYTGSNNCKRLNSKLLKLHRLCSALGGSTSCSSIGRSKQGTALLSRWNCKLPSS